jgi:hypothetical protein
MTLDGMKSLLAGRLGQRTDIDNMIYSELRQAQNVLEKTPPYPWFLLTYTTQEYFNPPYLLPAHFIEMADDYIYLLKATVDTTYYAEPGKVYGAYREHAFTTSPGAPGRPRNFNLNADLLQLFPIPDKSYTFYYFFYGRDTALSGPTSQNTWSNKAEDLMVAEAGWHVARNIRDAQRASEFGQDRAEARRRIAQESTSRLESMRRAVIGSGEDALLGQHSWEAGHQ